MTEIVRETVTTRSNDVAVVNPRATDVTGNQTIERLIYFLSGIVEILLVFRLVFKFTGASHGSYFVDLIYSLTAFLVMPFVGIFRSAVGTGIETTSILEPATIVAIIVYAVLAWGIVALVRILSKEQQTD